MEKRSLQIVAGGRVISRVPVCEKISDVAPLLAAHPIFYVVYDENVEQLCQTLMEDLSKSDPAMVPAGVYKLHATEADKNFGTVADICRWLMDCGADRKAFLLAMGGGITTDLAGFAASVYKRGIGFGFIPTTLLAQVDAAIGGKNGVNLDSYKNMMGVIRQPEFTLLCPEVLATLPYRTFLCGAAEMIKTFIISDDGWYAKAVDFLSGLRAAGDAGFGDYIRGRSDSLRDLIGAAAAVKCRVVSQDQYETGLRRVLNLGHTFAHALEKRVRLPHGEAVSVGMILAARLSEALGVAQAGLEARLREDFRACGLPSDCPCQLPDLAEAMTKDKKAESGQVRFVLIRSVGEVTERMMDVDEALRLIKG